jgi:hypothetical protein
MQKYNAGMMITELSGQGVKQFAELGLAFLLSAVIGLEREIRHKSARFVTRALDYAHTRLSELPLLFFSSSPNTASRMFLSKIASF